MDPTDIHPLGSVERVHVLSALLSGMQPGRKDNLSPPYQTLIQTPGRNELVYHWAIVLARCCNTRLAVSMPPMKTLRRFPIVCTMTTPHSESESPMCSHISDLQSYSSELLASIQQAAQQFEPGQAVALVLSNCLCATDTRLHHFSVTYLRGTALASWNLTNQEQLPHVQVDIADPDVRSLIGDLVTKKEGFYEFSNSTAAKWMSVACRGMEMAQAKVSSASKNGLNNNADLVDLGTCLHSVDKYLRSIPSAMWRLASLNECLHSLRQDTLDLNSVASPLDSELTDSNPEVAAFLDAIHSVTARVTSTLYLCQQQASSIPTQFTIVGSEAVHLDKITNIQANQTIDIWLDRTTEFFQRPLRATLPDIWASTRPHGDHPETCPEASLMAGLFREVKLSARFSEPPDISVGLDRNACPSCVLLAESIYEVCSIRFRLPGRHYQFSPWVPPKGLPDNVLNLLELKLQAYLLDRHVESLGFYSYKASQPNLMDIPKYRIAIEKDIAGTLFDDSDSELSDPASDDEYPIHSVRRSNQRRRQ